METSRKYSDYKYYLNRELSWLKFEERVLNEASDYSNPLMERLNFISITASNLDEFFMIRVASLKQQEMDNDNLLDICGLKPGKQLELIHEEAHRITSRLYEVYGQQKSQLNNIGIQLISNYDDLKSAEKDFTGQYFNENIAPLLTPFVIDSSRPFPLIKSKSLNIGFFLKEKSTSDKAFGIIQIPGLLDRLIRLSESKYLLLEELIKDKAEVLFKNYSILESSFFRVTRDAELGSIEQSGNILDIIMKQVSQRQWSRAVRLEVSKECSAKMQNFLLDKLSLKESQVYKAPESLDLTFLSAICSLDEYKDYRAAVHVPKVVVKPDTDIFSQVQKKDLLLIHPFEEYGPVIAFITKAALDPNVLAIKQTLYRVAENSKIAAALMLAAKNGKEVTVLIELKARFDEEKNIAWAQKLEEAGCTVLYGSGELKTHCKITLVIRKEKDKLCSYVHLGTGNYNENTAKLYTDVSLITAREEYGDDAIKVFNMLSGYSRPESLAHLRIAPYGLKEKLLELISRETTNALAGLKAGIRAKMNSLCDQDIIEALYEASMAGVKVELVVRGICCLRPGYSRVSDNIKVKSIVGTFLEHSRIFCFENAGDNEYYCASADWMPRNFERRVELMYPILDEDNKEKLNQALTTALKDNCKAYELNSDGIYTKIQKSDSNPVNSQKDLLNI